MLLSKSPRRSDQSAASGGGQSYPTDEGDDAPAAATAGAAAEQAPAPPPTSMPSLPPLDIRAVRKPSSSGSTGGSATGTGGGSASRTTSANTETSSVTFAPDSDNNNNDNNDTSASSPDPQQSRQGAYLTNEFSSFASDTSFVVQHNDDDDGDENQDLYFDDSNGDDSDYDEPILRHDRTKTKTKDRSGKKDKSGGRKKIIPREGPITHLKKHFQSHQTNADRSSSQGSSFFGNGSGNGNAGNAGAYPPLPTKPTLASRAKSAGSSHAGGSHATAKSQETLSKMMHTKRQSMRPCEIKFLQDLVRVGCEEEIEAAVETLADDSLFFEDDKDKKDKDKVKKGKGGEGKEKEDEIKEDRDGSASIFVNRQSRSKTGSSRSILTDGSTGDDDKDADLDFADALFLHKHAPPPPLQKSSSSPSSSSPTRARSKSMFETRENHLSSLDVVVNETDPDGTPIRTDDGVCSDGEDDLQLSNHHHPALKTSKTRRLWAKLGSAARIAALSKRTAKADRTLHGSIWRAHETGLGVTTVASEKSILNRRRSWLSGGGGSTGSAAGGGGGIATAQPVGKVERTKSGNRMAAFVDSNSGRESFISIGSPGIDDEHEEEVFRRQNEDDVFRPDSFGEDEEEKKQQKEQEDGDEVVAGPDDPLNTSAASAPTSPMRVSRPAGIGAAGTRCRRSISVGSVRSVKFVGGHTLHEFSGDSFNKLEISDKPPKARPPGPRAPTILRRSSSLARLPPSARRSAAAELGRARLMSNESSLGPATLSPTNSIPSIRHAHPIRSNSVLSTTSAVSAAPSLNLHRANPLRSNSILSSGSAISGAPSLNLHHANPIRSQSFLAEYSSVPFNGGQLLERNSSVTDSLLTFDEGDEGGSASMTSPLGSLRGSISEGEDEDDDAVLAAAQVAAAVAAAAAAAATSAERPPQPKSAPRPPIAPKDRPVMMREASVNNYHGVGFEVAEMFGETEVDAATEEAMTKLDSIDNARKYRSLVSENETSSGKISVDQSIKGGGMLLDDFMRTSMFRRTLSDDGMYGDMDSEGELFGSDKEDEDWDLESEPELQDAWNVLQDEYAVGYGSVPFHIIGTSADDVDSHPHVLSPPLMESLQPFFPYSVSEDNFYMKFSLVRDGASLHTLLQNIRGAKHTIIAIETVEGEVFGSFTSTPWRKNWNYFGSGESFLWRMRRSRDTPCHSVIDQAQLESELDVFPWTGENHFVQLCTSNKLAVGGGMREKNEDDEEDDAKMRDADGTGEQITSWDMEESPPFGFGLAIEDNLLLGTSNPCLTFASPPLSKKHADSSSFEILNIEVWTLTPCMTMEEAEKLELSRLFLEAHKQPSM